MKQSFTARNKKQSHLCRVNFFIVDITMAMTPPPVHMRHFWLNSLSRLYGRHKWMVPLQFYYVFAPGLPSTPGLPSRIVRHDWTSSCSSVYF